ncbi:hypothetical protein LM596_05730 [Liquorilactobacillus mali]|uniref:Histidine triad protein n=2 Tax=Liquorilactobacillus mali TaxID=1618 RepID=J1F2R0_9LACO|nr:histidine triad protein [Liquorilactobacillus mali KCTC 3596 = DSM 20444]KRN10414.1 histidine triad protein [Liquorilactobacillus mali KCTC 3596 = DSM 20444]QFQ74640.1 hypothetical protein LM596_05730 [Liquorilactobacillus mali]
MTKQWFEDRIGSALDGTNPMVMAELEGGIAVFGDTQFLEGYSVLLPKKEVNSLNDLNLTERTLFLRDMSILGDAVMQATDAVRINYDILGNTDNFLHAHVFPRYKEEEPEKLRKPVWLYSANHWSDKKYLYDSKKHAMVRNKITMFLKEFEIE